MIEIDPLIDYSKEQRRAIAFIDMKSFYASVECVERGLNPLSTSLCVMSGADNSAGLILASSPTFKKYLEKIMLVEVETYLLYQQSKIQLPKLLSYSST
jgi:DNA polymerase V